MMDLITIGAGIALVAGHVLGEVLRSWSSARASRVFFVALAVVAVSYVLLGAWTLWPVPVFSGLLFGAVQMAHARRLETARSWSILQIGALITIAAFAFLGLPILFAVGAAIPSEPVWGLSFFAAITAVTGLIATVGLGGAFMNVAIRPFAVKMRGTEVIEEGGRVISRSKTGSKTRAASSATTSASSSSSSSSPTRLSPSAFSWRRNRCSALAT